MTKIWAEPPPHLYKIKKQHFFQENVPYMVVVTPFLVTEGQASPCSQRHFGLTMYCPGFTVTSLHTSLVLHAGSWDGKVYNLGWISFIPFLYMAFYCVFSLVFMLCAPGLMYFPMPKGYFWNMMIWRIYVFFYYRDICVCIFFSFKSHGSEYHTQNYWSVIFAKT